MLNNEKDITNGPQGVFAIPDTAFLGRDITTPVEYFYLVLLGCLLAAFAAERIRDSRVGRAWEAIREDEDVAASMGIDTTIYKLLAFAIGAAIGAVGGVVFAAKQGSVFPQDFDLAISINVLAIVIIAGMGNVRAVILGSFLLIALPDVLRDFSINIGPIQLDNLGADYRLVIFGAALVAVMVWRPQGILPSRRREAEFEEVEQKESELVT
jgi:branched-chain amino acid transport system permease protein